MKGTIVCFLALAAVAFAAPAGKKEALNDEAQEIVDAVKSLTDAKKIAKMVRIIASQGDNSRAFIVSLNNLTPAAQTCAMTQAKALESKVKSKEILPENYPQAIVDACAEYKDQLQPTFDAYKAAMPEMNSGSSTFFHDLPQSVQTFFQHYGELSQEIQANPGLTKDTATFGPKVKALTDEFRAISEADRTAVTEKLPYTKEFLLSSGSHYADLNEMLDCVDSKAAGGQCDEASMKTKAQALQKYLASNAEQWFNYLNDKIDDYEVPEAVAQDGQVNKIASKLGKTGSQYAKMLFAQPQFNSVLNQLTAGDAGEAVEAANEA